MEKKRNFEEKNQLSQNISDFRRVGNISAAIDTCIEATKKYPDDNFFFKILGDLYMQISSYDKAADAYFENLKRIKRADLFKTFARFYERLQSKVDAEFLETYQNKIINAVKEGLVSAELSNQIAELLKRTNFIAGEDVRKLAILTNSDQNYEEVKLAIDKMAASNDTISLSYLAHYRIQSKINRKTTKRIDTYISQIMERYGFYNDAQDLIEKMIVVNEVCTKNIIAAFFRICRKKSDYSDVEKYFAVDVDFINASDFNIQYELVYYFEYLNDVDSIKSVLNRIKSSARDNPAISRTLYNFYLQFNMFDEADEELSYLNELLIERKTQRLLRIEEQRESEKAVWQKLKDLVSEQEHNRQMIALRDLLKGFSHELGQPITNIRYNAQLFKLRRSKGISTTEDIERLIELILNQTQRIGRLLDRFRPIVSSKSTVEKFEINSRIKDILNNLSSRLKGANIVYNVNSKCDITLKGDPVQFDQIFYNLILNSLQAIASERDSGKITITTERRAGKVFICFCDNGPGIPKEIQSKIFEPFFSTKEPSEQSGNEGLGLFIVWNILKIFNGKIVLDKKYTDGARFLIEILIEEEDIDRNE
ncbi:ATP-binding protein [Eubacterium callanderi]|uniref:sensor histidine kinase n=1 Tax=Eubacterium callanderi TaxID=53442 RepID=UPI003AF00DB1